MARLDAKQVIGELVDIIRTNGGSMSHNALVDVLIAQNKAEYVAVLPTMAGGGFGVSAVVKASSEAGASVFYSLN